MNKCGWAATRKEDEVEEFTVMTTTDAASELMNPFAINGEIGGHPITLETGRLAQQAHGSVTITCGETILLATAVMSEQAREGIDFLPLTVEFEERLYAVGKIPGSFFRREGRPGTEAILSARLTDRSIRPSVPQGTPQRSSGHHHGSLGRRKPSHPRLLGMVAASAALSISHIPFDGPIGACRVTWDGDDYQINPGFKDANSAALNMVVASNRHAIMMVESGSVEVSEEIILEGIRLAHESNVQTIDLIDRLVAERGSRQDGSAFRLRNCRRNARTRLMPWSTAGSVDILEQNSFKSERDAGLDAVETEVAGQLADDYSSAEVAESFKNLVKKEVRGRILGKNVRPDGRGTDEIRPNYL